jgi:hypothetical protein
MGVLELEDGALSGASATKAALWRKRHDQQFGWLCRPSTKVNASRNLEAIRREGRETWLKMRLEQPSEDLEELRRRAREDWLAEHGSGKKI